MGVCRSFARLFSRVRAEWEATAGQGFTARGAGSKPKRILFVVIGVVIGLFVGTFVRILVTRLVVVPFIVPLMYPSVQTYGDAPVISVVGALIQLAFMVVGGWMGGGYASKTGEER